MSASTPTSYRCPSCQRASENPNPRNLAIFIDGTSNKASSLDTNVLKLSRSLSDVEQLKVYFEGIGVHESQSVLGQGAKWIYSLLEMAFAWNVGKNVMEAYEWLAKKYQNGDRIYLFGFSRGAYQVRALAAMIHEVGLAKEVTQNRIEQAYHRYFSIDPHDPTTKSEATRFKKNFCWEGVRVHFIGVWDTVSSLGLIKRDVHVTASASVTNACHFRHALALDERRVKFIPEYFLEVNSHRNGVRGPRRPVSDVQEVWFPGYHSDVGGTSRQTDRFLHLEDEEHTAHAGRVSLLWMRREAASQGLIFDSEELPWCPDDVDRGRVDSMNWLFWKCLEFLPIRHQVGFCGNGKHKWRWHRSRPRLVIPAQKVHSSVLSGEVYTPGAGLGDGLEIPSVPCEASNGLWKNDCFDERATKHLLTPLLGDRFKTLKYLDRVFFLLDSLLSTGLTRTMRSPRWLEGSIREEMSIDTLAFIIVHGVISNSPIRDGSVKDFLRTTLPEPDRGDFPRVLRILSFVAKHQMLRRRYVAHDEMIRALMLALERITKSRHGHLFSLIIDSLRYLVDDSGEDGTVIHRLTAGAERSPLSSTLEAAAPSHLIASLKLIASVAARQKDRCAWLRPGIIDLAREERSPVGPMAVEALVALRVPFVGDVEIANVLGYLANTLPRLDVEMGDVSSPGVKFTFPPVFRVKDRGVLDDADLVMDEILHTIESRDARQRTTATLTLLKLCDSSAVRNFCSRHNVLDIFVIQLEQKETSLLAAYALKACLRNDMWTSSHFPRIAEGVVRMVENSWFDDAVGRIEGSQIFRDLMESEKLKKLVKDVGIIDALCRKLETGDPNDTRIGLICIEIFWGKNPEKVADIMTDALTSLRDKNLRVQMKGVRILSSLSRTEAGERAMKPRVNEIVKMLLPPPDGSLASQDQIFGPSAALYDLCKNESLREQILNSREYRLFRDIRHAHPIYPRTRK